MERALTREEAARILGVTVAADEATCKRAYRRLARDHHPDHGGDPATFHTLQAAFERLAAEAAGPPRPVVSRGKPSTPPVSFADATAHPEVDTLDWQMPLPDGRLTLERDLLARWLAGTDEAGLARPRATAALVTPLVATSRSPGSRLNRAAHLLATELTSRLQVGTRADDRGRAMVEAQVVAASRRGRKVLEAAAVTDGWVRRRRPSTTSLTITLVPSGDRRATALRVADHLDRLLARVGWDLEDWIVDRPATAALR